MLGTIDLRQSIQPSAIGGSKVRGPLHPRGEELDTGLKLRIRAIQDLGSLENEREPKIVIRPVEISAEKKPELHQALSDEARPAPADASHGHRGSSLDCSQHVVDRSCLERRHPCTSAARRRTQVFDRASSLPR
jgi:hypothetical protein